MNKSSELPSPNIVGWTYCVLSLSLYSLVGLLPMLEYSHRYYHGPSVSYDINHQGTFFLLMFLNLLYMIIRFRFMLHFSNPKPKIANPTWDMVIVAVVLLFFGIQTLLAMNLKIG
jgi:preprotein translocase subunit SecF